MVPSFFGNVCVWELPASWYLASCALFLLTLYFFMFSLYLPLSLALPLSLPPSLPPSLHPSLPPYISLYLCLSVVARHVSSDAFYQAAQCICMGCHKHPLLNQSYFFTPYLSIAHIKFTDYSPTIHRLFFTITILRAAWKTFFSLSGQPSSRYFNPQFYSCNWNVTLSSAFLFCFHETTFLHQHQLLSISPCLTQRRTSRRSSGEEPNSEVVKALRRWDSPGKSSPWDLASLQLKNRPNMVGFPSGGYTPSCVSWLGKW